MRKSDTKRKPARHFSIMIIPRGSAEIRRFEFSRQTLRTVLGLGITLGVLVCIGTISLFIYRHSYIATENVRVEAADFTRERSELLDRVGELEGTLARIERFASKIESAINVSSNSSVDESSMVGKGPVDEETWLPVPKPSASLNSSMRLGVSGWKSPFSKSLSKDLKLALDDLSERLDVAEGRVHSVFALQNDKLYFWASLPTIWPTKGWITSEFGDRRGWGGVGRIHEGIDIAAPRGTPVIAPGAGIVTYTGYRRGYGKVMVIDHGYGISTLYAHCQNVLVDEGQFIKRGMIVGSVGNTGRSTGPHLHYEVHVDGSPVNPLLYIMNDL